MTVIWSPVALDRVVEIAAWIAIDRPLAAENWVDEVFAAANRLERYPLSGRAVPELGRNDVREVLHGAYRIIYRTEGDHISVLTVRHARQLLSPEDLEG